MGVAMATFANSSGPRAARTPAGPLPRDLHPLTNESVGSAIESEPGLQAPPGAPAGTLAGSAAVVPIDLRPPSVGLLGRTRGGRRDRVRLGLASWAFTTRRVPPGAVDKILPPVGRPRVGDLVLARVDALGQHSALHLVNGRRRTLFPGVEVVVAYGHRYAPAQFEAEVPESFGPCHLVAGGGVASRVRSWHRRMSAGPTEITPVGVLCDADGRRINLRSFALDSIGRPRDYQPTTIAVAGTSMDSGKTQTCAHLVRGLTLAGSRVGYAKVTGTGAGGDYWSLKDAGADPVLDFTDAGVPSTYLLPADEVEGTTALLLDHVARHGVDAIVIEVADGILQKETASLLGGRAFASLVGGIVLAAQDSMGALAGYRWLRERETPVLALSGVLTAAPLQVREAREATGLPVHDRESLATAHVAMDLLGQAQHAQHARQDRPARATEVA